MGALFFLIWSLITPPLAKCDFGGHDLFTSLAQLEQLWKNELEIVPKMEKALDVNETVSGALKMYLSQHYLLGLNREPNYDFLGHPLNAYFFVRHVAHGWTMIKRSLAGIDTNKTTELAFLSERESEKLPDLYDVEGAAFGLVRLHSLYRYDLHKFAHDGIISTTLDNGQVVLSDPSVINVTSYELVKMGLEATSHGLYDSACDLMDLATAFAKEEKKSGQDFSFLHDYNPSPETFQNLAASAKKVHDHFLDTRGMVGRFHRTHQFPYDSKLRKKKKFSKGFTLKDPVVGRALTERLVQLAPRNNDADHRLSFASEVQMTKLCRGGQIRSPSEMSKLHCKYVHGSSAWLRLAPIKLEINSFDPYHVVLRELLYDHECDDITKYLGPKLDFPPGRMHHKAKKNDWTMKNCWPDETNHKALEKLNKRIEHLSGLRADSSKRFSEGFMCGNYGIGGWYFIHPDFHTHGDPTHYVAGSRGNRVSTILTVLQSPEAGGATVWPNAGISVFPEKGSAVWWYNLRTSDVPDYYTRHAACPVLLGQKWIGNKWVGFNAQWNGRKCALNPGQRFDGPYE